MSWRFDCHVHSQHSKDGKGTIMELAEAAQAAGLHGFALTDHDTVVGHQEIAAAMEATGLLIVPGIEVTTAEGHVLALNVAKDIPRGKSFARTAKAIEKQGGIAVLAHPLRMFSGIGPTRLREHHAAGLIAAIEGRNARERPLVQANTMKLGSELQVSMLAGSDAHWVKDIGTAYTEFDSPAKNAKALVAMIRDGLCRPGGGHLPRRKVWAHGASLVVPERLRRKLQK